MKRLSTLLSFFLCALIACAQLVVSQTQSEGAFPLVGEDAATIVYDSNEAEVVSTIAKTVAGDIRTVTGKRPSVSTKLTAGKYPVIAGTVGESTFITDLVNAGKLDVSDVEGKWEAYGLAVVDNPAEGIDKALVVFGSQSRSTAYALFELSKQCGVSPWVYWADVTPRHKDKLWVSGSMTVDSPSVKYRGIFLNDEDFGLQPWAAKNLDNDKNNIGPKTYAKIMELLLRLRANTLWPAMHACSAAFFYYKDNIPVAKKYAIYMGSSHCEQMLRDNEWEWNRYGGHYNDDWNWKTNRSMIQQYWEERVAETVDVNGIYTLGMRGVHDSAMNGYNTTSERVAALNEVIAWQRELLGRYFDDVTKVPQLFIPYKEVLDCYNAGLQIPEDVMLMWVDDNHGYVRQLPNAKEQARSGGNAVYYHLSYWGTPASYLWLPSISPSLCSFELTKCYEQGVTSQWIINVGDIKPAEEEMQFCMDLGWDINSWTPSEAWKYTRHWAAETFGEEYADDYADIKLAYYQLAAAGKPEHVHINTYTISEMNDRIARYQLLAEKVDALKVRIPSDLQDAFFQLLEYPVKCAGYMNEKHFWAQQSITYAEAGQGDTALQMAADARKSYRLIKDMTDQYNIDVANGKWNGMMSYHPQNSAHFYMPDAASISTIKTGEREIITETDIAYISAGEYKDCSADIQVVKGLGISGETAMVWPEETKLYTPNQAKYIIYNVPVRAGKNNIQIRCLPTFPLNSSFDLRVAVRIDTGAWTTKSVKTVAMQNTWNQTVAQGYSPAEVQYNSEEDKVVEVKVALLDPGVAVSQIVSIPEVKEDNTLTEECIVNYDFELKAEGQTNDGTTVRGVPYGWKQQGTLNGNSYGINNDAKNIHGANVCWMNSSPMPSNFKLYQTIPASKLGKGNYRVSCRMWMESGKKATGRLYANNNVQYYGYAEDYTNLLVSGEKATYAGHAGLESSNMTLQDMEVYVTLDDGESLELGIKTSNKKNDGTSASDNTGWFKVDYFRIERVESIPEDVVEDMELTEKYIVNYDFEQYKNGNNVLTNTSGETHRYTPYGWNISKSFPGNSYGINNDAANQHATNVCWFQPKEGFMPDGFELYQEIPDGELESGRYLVQCKLWVEDGYLATTRLFANNNVQYYGMDIDYEKNLTEGEVNTFAGYVGGTTSSYILQDMYVYVDISEGESLRFGIRSDNRCGDGTKHPDYKNGWFKVDYFRINRVGDVTDSDPSDIHDQSLLMTSSADTPLYDLQGRQISTASKGVYIQNGRKMIR